MMHSASNDTQQRDSTSSPAIALKPAVLLRPQACVTLAGAPCSRRLSSSDEICGGVWGANSRKTKEEYDSEHARTHGKKLRGGRLPPL